MSQLKRVSFVCDRASKTLAGDMADVVALEPPNGGGTVAAELSAALHHSRDGRQVSRIGLRAQKTDSSWSGRRPGVPEDPGPPQLGVERAACPRSTGLPPLPDLCGGEVHDATLVKFLLRQTLLQRKKEEEERKKEEEEEEEKKEQFLEQSMQELRLLSKTPLAGRSLQQTNRMMELLKLRDAASSSSSKRKRKKRRKKKLPRCVSSRGRARRQLRQCLLSGCSVFPSIDDWPQMLDIIASMDQKDSIPRLWCAHRRLRQWNFHGWFYCLRCFRAVFSLIVGRPVLPGIIEVLDRVVRCPLRNDTPHGPDSADLRARAVLGQGGDSPVAPVEPPQVHFLDEVIVISTGALVQTVKTVWKFCSCCSSKVVDIPVFTQ